MKKRFSILAIMAAILLAALAASPVAGAAKGQDGPIPTHIIVFNEGVDARDAAGSLANAHGLSVNNVYTHALSGMAAVVPAGRLNALANDPRVAFVEANQVVEAFDIPTGIERVNALLNTIAAINGDGGEVDVDIAIIDTGVTPHAEFADRMVPGTNIVNPGSSDTTDAACPHGTHVAGIAAAQGNNGIGVAGMNWGALIMPVRVLPDCFGNESDIAAGIVWAVDNGADICNVSLESSLGAPPLQDAVNYAYDQGVLVVAAAGNSGNPALAFPARFANCMSVSATDHNDDLWVSSNYGATLDVSAPGENIFSTWPVGGDNYFALSGTSQATPHVSGLASLIKSYVPGLGVDEIRSIINTTADDLGTSGWDPVFGHGRINAYIPMLA
ncbi:MAG: S8 family serine peptidase, partial [Chloroflexi bacterium]|nr:S8 family serine peptidase [Chloroflexota bacterium]